MSRSKKIPIMKDRPRNHNRAAIYWRTVRRVINEKIKYHKEDVDETVIPLPSEIVNDYDYIDYICDFRFDASDRSDYWKNMAKRVGRK